MPTLSITLTVLPVLNMSHELAEKIRLSCQPQTNMCTFVTFPQGEAIHQPEHSGTVTVRLRGVIRTHYGYRSIATCLADCYGL
jgi:hypothetical protein